MVLGLGSKKKKIEAGTPSEIMQHDYMWRQQLPGTFQL